MNALAPASSVSATSVAETSEAQQMTFAWGAVARNRRISSEPESPSRESSVTTMSGRVRAQASTARMPSVATSISSAAPEVIRAYWSCARPSGESHSTTLVGIVSLVSAPCRSG